MTEKLIASYSLEATARFMAGGELGPPTIHDPELAEKMDRQQRALLAAFDSAVHEVAYSMRADGERSAERLRSLWDGAKSGDARQRQLFAAMWFQLLTNALTPVERP